jgi:flagellar hook-length control protein FliK
VSSTPAAVAAPPARAASSSEQGAVPVAPPPAIVSPTTAAILLPSQPLPAGIAFGSALAIAFADQRAKNEAQPADENPLLGLVATTLHASATAAIGDASHAALDMRHDDWPQAMIDRIEALRDAADANDTRIRLLPDALGKVDVSLRHDGDAVHVHFAAELPTTQTLLNNAQPRLAELAQTRGLRISQGAVDSDAAGAGQQQRGTLPQSPPSTRPASATTLVADAGTDSRLA